MKLPVCHFTVWLGCARLPAGRRSMRLPAWLGALAVVAFTSCSRPAPITAHAAPAEHPPAARMAREVRVTGIVEAIHSTKVLVPQLYGQFSQMTLTKIVPNGMKVKEGDLIAIFDATQQIDQARDAKAKFEDLGHQVEQKIAANRADAEKRAADLRQAEADLAKAEIELQKGPVLSDIDRLKPL